MESQTPKVLPDLSDVVQVVLGQVSNELVETNRAVLRVDPDATPLGRS